mgnify:CR=1 FL=1
MDITYIPMRRGFLYLVAIMDWFSRKVLSWRLSNTMDVGFCIEALKDALARYGPPEIFNSDQGSQFTSTDFTDVLRWNLYQAAFLTIPRVRDAIHAVYPGMALVEDGVTLALMLPPGANTRAQLMADIEMLAVPYTHLTLPTNHTQ